MTRVWPAEHAPARAIRVDWPLLVTLGLLAACAYFVEDPLALAILFIGACLMFLFDRDGARSALREGLRAIQAGEHPRAVAGRLRGIRLGGRAAFCRDVAARCLEGAGRCHGLDWRLRREATVWLREAIREMK